MTRVTLEASTKSGGLAMSRLSRFKPSGTMLVALVALVMATTGSAVAASLITSKQIKDGTITTKDINKKAIKSLKGKTGASGATGATGAQGPKGDKGDKGDAGTNGTNGSNGTNGTALGYARISATGNVDPSPSQTVVQANVSHPGTGIHCFSGPGFTPNSVQVPFTSSGSLPIPAVG